MNVARAFIVIRSRRLQLKSFCLFRYVHSGSLLGRSILAILAIIDSCFNISKVGTHVWLNMLLNISFRFVIAANKILRFFIPLPLSYIENHHWHFQGCNFSQIIFKRDKYVFIQVVGLIRLWRFRFFGYEHIGPLNKPFNFGNPGMIFQAKSKLLYMSKRVTQRTFGVSSLLRKTFISESSRHFPISRLLVSSLASIFPI